MTNQQEVIEGNRLIAEFEYGKLIEDEYPIGSKRVKFIETEDREHTWILNPADDVFNECHHLEYHSNWNWLMPAWKKVIEVIGLWAHTHSNPRYSKVWVDESEKISREFSSVNIKGAFTRISNLISWYNTLPQNTGKEK